MKSATVIIPTIGAAPLAEAIASVLAQTHRAVDCWVVIDGAAYRDKARLILGRHPGVKIIELPDNTGVGGFHGHRIYAAMSHLFNSDYVLYLDEDNWMLPDHVASQIGCCEAKSLDWSHSLRRIHRQDGAYVCDDNCESLGKWPVYGDEIHHLVDTNCYCIRRDVAARVAGAWHAGWGADREFYKIIARQFHRFDTTGRHTLCYRLKDNSKALDEDFFRRGNEAKRQMYGGDFPWLRPARA